MPSKSEVAGHQRLVDRTLRAIERSERERLTAMIDSIEAAQSRIRDVVARGDPYGVMVNDLKSVMADLEVEMDTHAVDAITTAHTSGLALADTALEAVADAPLVPASPEYVPIDLKVLSLQGSLHKHVSQMLARALVALAHVAVVAIEEGGATPRTAGDRSMSVLKIVGTTAVGSKVFGQAAAHAVGTTRAAMGDTTNMTARGRSKEIEAAGGPRTLKRWVHSGSSAEQRSDHLVTARRYANGIPWDQKFEVGPYRTLYPRGEGLPGPQRYGCRCKVAPVLQRTET